MDKPGNSAEQNAQYIQQIYQSILASSAKGETTPKPSQSRAGTGRTSQSKTASGSQSKISEILSQAKAGKQPEKDFNVISSGGGKLTIAQSHGRIVKGRTVENIVQSSSKASDSVSHVVPPPSRPKAQPSILGPKIPGRLSGAGGGPVRGRIQQIPRHQPYPVEPDVYYMKWKRLKKYIKNMVFMNASVCDEVVRAEEKIARAKEERRFLLRKLLHYQSLSENQSGAGKQLPTSLLKSPPEEVPGASKVKAKKKSLVPMTEKKKPTKDLLASMKAKPKKSRASSSNKHIVPPIPLDPLGRPIFPINLGDLTIHSVGEIVPDRSGFHTSNSIFPVGYCSTRVYCSIQNPETQCLYTCKISDGGKGPSFEIVPEDNSDVFKSRFLSECHSMLLRKLNQTRGLELVDTAGKGPEFFGLSHPVVQNLIQSCPGAKKCNGYKWIRFEVNKTLTVENMASVSEDPAISFHALKSKLYGGRDKGLTTASLRSLLTGALNGGAAQTKQKS